MISECQDAEKRTYGYRRVAFWPERYTSNEFNKLTKELNITPSMSRHGKSYDNALTENFFSILKTECIHRVKLNSFDEARQLIDD